MKLVPAICTHCGGTLTVDPEQDAYVCPFCNTPFVTEKAINNYINQTTNIVNNTTVNNTTNISNTNYNIKNSEVHIHSDAMTAEEIFNNIEALASKGHSRTDAAVAELETELLKNYPDNIAVEKVRYIFDLDNLSLLKKFADRDREFYDKYNEKLAERVNRDCLTTYGVEGKGKDLKNKMTLNKFKKSLLAAESQTGGYYDRYYEYTKCMVCFTDGFHLQISFEEVQNYDNDDYYVAVLNWLLKYISGSSGNQQEARKDKRTLVAIAKIASFISKNRLASEAVNTFVVLAEKDPEHFGDRIAALNGIDACAREFYRQYMRGAILGYNYYMSNKDALRYVTAEYGKFFKGSIWIKYATDKRAVGTEEEFVAACKNYLLGK